MIFSSWFHKREKNDALSESGIFSIESVTQEIWSKFQMRHKDSWRMMNFDKDYAQSPESLIRLQWNACRSKKKEISISLIIRPKVIDLTDNTKVKYKTDWHKIIAGFHRLTVSLSFSCRKKFFNGKQHPSIFMSTNSNRWQ